LIQDVVGERGRLWALPYEAFRVLGIGGREDADASVLDGGCTAVVNVERSVHSDAGMGAILWGLLGFKRHCELHLS
jgi:hypothetical protein